jgi:hypothetical protein
MRIEGTDFAVVFVTDFPRAVEFYGETPGTGRERVPDFDLAMAGSKSVT